MVIVFGFFARKGTTFSATAGISAEKNPSQPTPKPFTVASTYLHSHTHTPPHSLPNAFIAAHTYLHGRSQMPSHSLPNAFMSALVWPSPRLHVSPYPTSTKFGCTCKLIQMYIKIKLDVHQNHAQAGCGAVYGPYYLVVSRIMTTFALANKLKRIRK